MSDLITPESLNEHQEIIEYNQQEFKDNFKYKLFRNSNNDLYLVFDYNNEDLSTGTKIETVFETIYEDTVLLKTGTFVFEQVKDMTIFENDIISYLDSYTIDIPNFFIFNYSEDLEYLIDYSLFKKITDSSKKIEIDLKKCSIDLEPNESITLDSFNMTSGHFLVDKSFILQCNDISINQMYLNSYNDKYADSTFNFLTEKGFVIKNLQLYAATKLNIICNNTDGSTYLNTELNINYCSVYGKETVKNDLNSPRLSIKGFYNCYLDTLEIEEGVSYGTIVSFNLMNYVFLGSIHRDIKNIRNGDTIQVNDVAKLTVGGATITIREESDIVEDVSFIKYKGLPGSDKRILLSGINIDNRTDYNFTFFKLDNDSITKLTMSNNSISKNVSIFKTIGDDSSILKATLSYLTVTSGDMIDIKDCDMITISNCDLSLDNIYVTSKQINIIECNFNSNNIVLQSDSMTKCTTNNTVFVSKNMTIKNENAEYQPKTYFKNSNFSISDTLSLENISPSISNSYLKLLNLNVISDSFIKCNEVIIEPLSNGTIFNIGTSIIGYFSLNTIDNYYLELNIQDKSESLIRNTIEIISNDINIKGRPIVIKTNYPIDVTLDKCNVPNIDIYLSESDSLSENASTFKTTISSQKYILDPNKKYDLISVPSQEGSDYTSYTIINK